jgi:chromosomal replication initiation ATPase DnaA
MEYTPAEAWTAALEDLALQLTRSTYNMHLADSICHHGDDGHYTIEVKSEQARAWLQTQLYTTVTDTLTHITGRHATVSFVTRRQTTIPFAGGPHAGSGAPLFPGFEPYQSNFVQVPKQFFEIVVPAGPPVVVAFVAGVINNTIGVIVNYHTHQRREWWAATHIDIMAATGIESVVSVRKAIKLSRQAGYVIQAGTPKALRYRLRRAGEPVDNPENNPQKRIIF